MEFTDWNRIFEEEVYKHRGFLLKRAMFIVGKNGDADDMVQETLIKAWRGLRKFDHRSSMLSWLSVIMTHTCFDHLKRAHNRQRWFSWDDVESPVINYLLQHSPPSPDSSLYYEELKVWTWAELKAEFPVHYRTILTLRVIGGYSIEETVEITGQPDYTVKTAVFATKGYIQKKLRGL